MWRFLLIAADILFFNCDLRSCLGTIFILLFYFITQQIDHKHFLSCNNLKGHSENESPKSHPYRISRYYTWHMTYLTNTSIFYSKTPVYNITDQYIDCSTATMWKYTSETIWPLQTNESSILSTSTKWNWSPHVKLFHH